jgi:CHAT domain-containing protein/Tfp pilus assembly protein PilF
LRLRLATLGLQRPFPAKYHAPSALRILPVAKGVPVLVLQPSLRAAFAGRSAVAQTHGILRVGTLCALATTLMSAPAQEARWYQLSEQAVQLKNQGKLAEALPFEQQAAQVAESTWGPEDVHLGLSLNVLGILEMDLEKFTDAETHLKRALEIMTRTKGAESSDVGSVLNNLGILYQDQANYAAAEKVTEQALAIEEKLLGENDAHVATDENNLALIFMKEDKFPEAEALYKKAIATDQRLGRTDVTTDLGNLGTLYDEMGRYPDAEQAFTQALTLDLKALGAAHPQIGLDLYRLATAFQYEGKFPQAEQAYGKAMVVEQNAGSHDQATISAIEENMGSLYRDEGKYPAAESMFLEALRSRAQALGPNHPDVASVLDSLGRLYTYENRYSDAERALQQALSIDMKSLGAANLQTGGAMLDLANLYGTHGQSGPANQLYYNAIQVYLKVLGQSDKRVADVIFAGAQQMLDDGTLDTAAKMFNMAGGIFQQAEGASSLDVAKCQENLGAIAEDMGRHDDAERLQKSALAIYEKISGPDSPGLSPSLEGLGRIYKDEHRFADAEPFYQRQLKIDQAHLKPNDPGLRDAEADLAGLYYVWGKPEQAAPYFQTYLGNLMDEFRLNAATMSERERLIYFSTQRRAFPLFFSFVLKFHDQAPELTGRMYDALLEEKGLIAASATAMRAAVEASGDEQAVQMLDKLASDKAQLAALVESTTGDPANHREQINQLGDEANTLEQDLLKRSAVMSRQKTQNAATWRDVQKALKPGESAVEVTRFQFDDGFTGAGEVVYVALVVTPDGQQPALVLLGKANDLEAAPMLAYRADVGQTRGLTPEEEPAAPGQPPASAPNTSAAYAAFWEPLEPALSGTKRVYFSPDGVLNTIPVGLLADPDGKLVMEKVQLRLVNSTKDILVPAPSAEQRAALLVGNPAFNLTADQQRSALAQLRGQNPGIAPGAAQTANSSQAAPSPGAQLASRGGDLKGGDLNPLPGTQVEVDAVDKLLKDAGWQASEYTGDLALKETMTQAHSPRIVHIATHGFFLSDEELKARAEAQGQQANLNEDPMLRSGLFFAGADRVREGTAPQADVDDGVLTAYEASQLNLQGTELVVLSACETGLGKELNSDGVFGLRRGLQEAGAGAVMMSMWSVPDKETQELMTLFYAKWLGGLEKPEALRQAQLVEREVVRKRYGRDLPFYWGAFVMVSP